MDDRVATRARWRWAVPPALAVVVLGPLLTGRGFALAGDMVFVPEQPWKAAWYGGDGAVPRAVPGDAWVSVLTHLVPGDLLQKALLVLLLSAAGWGVLRLLDGLPATAALAGAVLYQWNPYVHERLGIGHWALLCGYAALPWCALGATRVVERGWRSLPWVVVPAGLAATASPTGGLLAALVVGGIVGCALLTRRVALGGALGTALALAGLNLPWLLPGLLDRGGLAPDAAGAAAFAARADTPWGLGPSLVSLGAIWKSAVHAPERASWLVSGLSVALVAVAVVGLVAAAMRGGPLPRPTVLGMVVPGATLFVAAWVLSTTAGRPLMEWVITELPGGGLARDAQKWVAPLALVTAIGVGYAVAGLVRRLPAAGRPAVPIAVTLLPVALLPSMAWGLTGFLERASYPPEWVDVAGRLEQAGAADDRLLVLPFSVYRRFPWAHERAVLDPAPRFFPGQVVSDDRLTVEGDLDVGGEEPDGLVVRAAIEDGTLPQAVDRLGIRWVLVERSTPGATGWPTGVGTVVHDGPELLLVDTGAGRPATLSRWRGLYLASTALAAAAVLGCAAGICAREGSRLYAGRRRGSMT